MNPLVFLLFSAGFFSIHAIRPSASALLLALSYLFGAAAFTVDILEQAGVHLLGIIPIAAIYALTAVLFSGAVSLRYRGWAPWLLYAALFAGHMSVYSWTYLTFGLSWGASIAANFGCGVIFAFGAFTILNRTQRVIDKVVFWLCIVGALQCFVRPVVLAYLVGGMSSDTYDFSLFLIVLHFVVGACAVVLGMALLVAFSSEIMSDLERRSVTDRLSGLLNRRGFEDMAGRVFQQKDADNDVISVIITDIDHFKKVNDTKGHALGDMVIAEMGALIGQYAVKDRFAGRIGGEEFAIVLVGERLQGARDVAEALRSEFAAMRIDNGDPDAAEYAFTASFGVAMRQPGETMRALLTRADEALYLAKAKGRNQVACETDVLVHKLRTIDSEETTGGDDRRKFRDAEPSTRKHA